MVHKCAAIKSIHILFPINLSERKLTSRFVFDNIAKIHTSTIFLGREYTSLAFTIARNESFEECSERIFMLLNNERSQ